MLVYVADFCLDDADFANDRLTVESPEGNMLFLHVIRHELVGAEVETALLALDAFFLVLQEMLHELLSSVRGRALVRGQRECLEAARALQLVRAVVCLLEVVYEVSVE